MKWEEQLRKAPFGRFRRNKKPKQAQQPQQPIEPKCRNKLKSLTKIRINRFTKQNMDEKKMDEMPEETACKILEFINTQQLDFNIGSDVVGTNVRMSHSEFENKTYPSQSKSTYIDEYEIYLTLSVEDAEKYNVSGSERISGVATPFVSFITEITAPDNTKIFNIFAKKMQMGENIDWRKM